VSLGSWRRAGCEMAHIGEYDFWLACRCLRAQASARTTLYMPAIGPKRAFISAPRFRSEESFTSFSFRSSSRLDTCRNRPAATRTGPKAEAHQTGNCPGVKRTSQIYAVTSACGRKQASHELEHLSKPGKDRLNFAQVRSLVRGRKVWPLFSRSKNA